VPAVQHVPHPAAPITSGDKPPPPPPAANGGDTDSAVIALCENKNKDIILLKFRTQKNKKNPNICHVLMTATRQIFSYLYLYYNIINLKINSQLCNIL